MAEDPRHEDEGEVSGEAPGGWKGKIRGYRLIDIVVAVTLIWVVVGKPIMDSKREDERMLALAKEHAAISHAQDKIATAFDEFSFIITLPQDKRETLNITMPQSLRDKICTQDRRRGK